MFVMTRTTLTPFVIAVCLVAQATAETVQFFYNLQQDTCAWGTDSYPANENTSNGGVCAYVESIDRVYACPAPDPTCWSWGLTCSDGAGADQIQCNRNGATWCCSAEETCTQGKDQINVCISEFASPNSGVSAANARAAEYSVVPSASIGTTAVTAIPSVFSTAQFAVSGQSTSSSSSSSSSASSSASTSTATSSAASKSSSHSSITSKSASAVANTATASAIATASKSGLSGGAIAGIVIGALVGLAMILGTIIFLVLHRRRETRQVEAAPAHSPVVAPGHGQSPSGYSSPNTQADYHGANNMSQYLGYYHEKPPTQINEAPLHPDNRAEMPPDSVYTRKPVAERVELQ